MKKRPLIAVSGPGENHLLSWWCVGVNLWLAGACMRKVTPNDPATTEIFDGIIITGGSDVDPERYGGQRKQDYAYDEQRDAIEVALIARAFREKLPLLGICRGAQLINVCQGGTLHMDIRLVCESARYPEGMFAKIFYRKPVVIKDGSMLAKLFKTQALMVNSLHRQSLDKIGNGLQVSAWEENSIVQAVEAEHPNQYVVGVQWHPEFMLFSRQQRGLFKAFVQATLSNFIHR